MSDKEKWLDGELWNFVRGAAIDLEIPLKSPAEEQLYWHMKQACGVYANVLAVECRAPAPQWVIIADGEGASVELVYESDPHEAVHRFMCCCGQSLSECKTPFIPRDVALIDDSDAWSTDESGEKFSVDWPHETGRVTLYKLSKLAATPQVTAPQPADEHVCQTPDYTDGPCYACAKDMLMEWVFERYENCVRISDEKTGEDRAEWLKDADHFMLILDLLRGAATPQVTPHFPDCNVGTSHECCVARMKRLEKEQYGHARESRRTPGKAGKVERD